MSKTAFDLKRSSIYQADPLELCIIGGANTMPADQVGPHDTDRDEEHALWDPRVLDVMTDDMVKNVYAYGVIVPIIVAKLDDQGRTAVVVDGRQRVRAARLANLMRKAKGEPTITLKCEIRSDDDTGLMAAMVATNAVRHDDDATTTIYKLRRLMKRGVSLDDAAVTHGVPVKVAESWIRFDDNAVPDIKRAVGSGRLSISAGIEIARLAPAEQATAMTSALASAPEGKAPSVKATRKAIQKTSGKRAPDGFRDKSDQMKLLAYVQAKAHPKNLSDRSIGWYQGVEDMLMFIHAEGLSAGVTKLKELAEAMEVAAKEDK